MRIVVAVRCFNEQNNIERFMRGYDFADTIVVSDGGSTDDSVSILHTYPKVQLIHFTQQETIDGETWNPDAPHMNFVLDAAKALNPDWLIFDDMDCVPNWILRDNACYLLEKYQSLQINVFRLYLWGDDKFFPKMNDNFNPSYESLWAWRPDRVDIRADETVRHGTLTGLHPVPYNLELPFCLLHKSWHPNTIESKIDRYNKLGLPMSPLSEFAGEAMKLPEWAVE